MNKDEMKDRTRRFALDVMDLIEQVPSTNKGRILADQLLRSATSVGANYRAACRGRSTAEFVAKLGTVLEEADESAFWLELIDEGGLLDNEQVRSLHKEADEICAMVFTARRTAREK